MSTLSALRARRPATGLAFVLVAVFIWGAVPFLTSYVAQELQSAELLVLRMLGAGVVLTLMAGPRRLWDALRSNLGSFVALSLIGFGLPNLLYVYALRTNVPIPVLSFIADSYTIWAIVMAVIFLRERPSAYHLIAIVCALAGLFLMSGVTLGSDLGVPSGILLALATSLGWASSSVVGKKMLDTLDGPTVAAGRHVLSGLLLCPFMLVEGTHMAHVSLATWLIMGLLIVMSIASYWIYYHGMQYASVSSASLVETFTPVVTWSISALAFGQGLTRPQIVAACLILAGSVLVTVRDLRAHASMPP
jgi:drug/metabolite transporter, DME family